MKLLKFISQHKWQIISLSALMIFRGKFIEWITEYVCPITSYVAKDSWLVLVLSLATVGILYAISYQQIIVEREKLVSRYWTISWLFFIYLIFRIKAPFVYYGIGDIPLNYIDYVWMLVLVIEIVLYAIRNKRMSTSVDTENDTYPFIMDTPAAKDNMGRHVYAEQLVGKIIATANGMRLAERDNRMRGAFTILLNEHYGVGKTSFMLQLQEIAEKKGLEECWFKPWLYDDNSSLIVNLIHVLQEKLGEGDRPLANMLDRYARVLSSVEQYEWVSVFQHDTTSIETRFEEIKEKLHELKLPIIVLIDDVDRLQSEELMRMLQMVRNMADFPYVYYIIAGDKSAIMNRLKEAQIAEPYEYLKKFFNLEISLPGVDDQIDHELEAYIQKIQAQYNITNDEILEFLRGVRYKKEIFANMRDIKRYLNMLDFVLANLRHNDLLDEVSLRDVAGICLIQHLDTEFYQLMRDHNDYILRYESSLDRLFVKNGFEKALKYSSDKREAATAYACIEKEAIKSGTVSLDDPTLSIPEVIDYSRIPKIEIIGDILYRLFPTTWYPHSKVGICYPTEYFKYFSASYKKNEMTNAEIIGIMGATDADYADKIKKIISGNRTIAYIHKIDWYVNTQEYQRLDVLDKVLFAFEKHFKAVAKPNDSIDVFYSLHYERAVLDIFLSRKDENEKKRDTEWNRLYKWLTTSREYQNRIRVLQTITGQSKDANMYIFNSAEVLRDCVQASASHYISIVWTKQKYTPAVYGRLDDYRRICNSLSLYEFVSDSILAVLRMKRSKKSFVYHLVEPYKDGLKWNSSLIECVTGNLHAFTSKDSKWFELIPNEWKQDFINVSIKGAIKPEDIQNSSYFRAAMRYWNSQKRGEEKLK